MIDIYCKNNKCPICDSNITNVEFIRKSCKNGCYSIRTSIDSYVVFVFGVTYGINPYNKFSMVPIIGERIKYWRKDYRYLAEILERM